MKPLLERDHYLSEEVLSLERRRLFFSQWQFATVSLCIPNNNDYVVVNIAGKEVIIQNFSGKFSAFTNVCSHRYSTIHNCPRGNRPLQCSYHRWAYDSDGIPRGIPERADFAEIRDCSVTIEELRLEQWTLAQCGNLIFIRLENGRNDLQTFLGDQFERLKQLSLAFDQEILSTSTVYQANWKVVIQNTLEAYHVASIHPTTFGRLIRSKLIQKEISYPHIDYVSQPIEAIRPLSKTRQLLSDTLAQTFAKSRLGVFEDSNAVINELLFLWPTTTLGHTNGKAFALLHYTPLAPDRTELRVSQWYPKLHDASSVDERRRIQSAPIITGFLSQVAEEDRIACENVQRGIRNASTLNKGLLADQESMVYQFQKIYLQALSERA